MKWFAADIKRKWKAIGKGPKHIQKPYTYRYIHALEKTTERERGERERNTNSDFLLIN